MVVVHFTTLPGGPYKALHVVLKKSHIFCNISVISVLTILRVIGLKMIELYCTHLWACLCFFMGIKGKCTRRHRFPTEHYFRKLQTIIDPPHCNAGTVFHLVILPYKLRCKTDVCHTVVRGMRSFLGYGICPKVWVLSWGMGSLLRYGICPGIWDLSRGIGSVWIIYLRIIYP